MAVNFVYRARDHTGNLVTGELLADSPAAVAAHIRRQGLLVVKIDKTRSQRGDSADWLAAWRGVPLRDLTVFCRQFSTMVSAGLPLVNALAILIEQTTNPVLRQALGSVYKQVQEGSALSAALAQHPHVFPKVMVYLVEAGELGGVLDKVLERLALQFEKDDKLNGKVRTAVVYPAAVLSVALLVLIFILVFIMPKFVAIYSQLGATLPLPTRILLNVSDFLRGYGLLVLAAAAAGLFLVSRGAGFAGWKALTDAVILRLPVFGLLYRKVAIARFSRTLGMLVQGGVPIIQALDVVKHTANLKPMVTALTAAQDSIREGFSFAAPLGQSGLFPPMVVQMVSIGEATGQLDGLLAKVAEFYENDVDDMVSRLSSLLEPFIIVVLGVILGGIIIAVLYPMLDVVGKFNG